MWRARPRQGQPGEDAAPLWALEQGGDDRRGSRRVPGWGAQHLQGSLGHGSGQLGQRATGMGAPTYHSYETHGAHRWETGKRRAKKPTVPIVYWGTCRAAACPRPGAAAGRERSETRGGRGPWERVPLGQPRQSSRGLGPCPAVGLARACSWPSRAACAPCPRARVRPCCRHGRGPGVPSPRKQREAGVSSLFLVPGSFLKANPCPRKGC